jgi:hypothetical protein
VSPAAGDKRVFGKAKADDRFAPSAVVAHAIELATFRALTKGDFRRRRGARFGDGLPPRRDR